MRILIEQLFFVRETWIESSDKQTHVAFVRIEYSEWEELHSILQTISNSKSHQVNILCQSHKFPVTKPGCRQDTLYCLLRSDRGNMRFGFEGKYILFDNLITRSLQ